MAIDRCFPLSFDFIMKQAQSGLRTIKRDFSAGNASSQPIDVDDIEWAPTPPNAKPIPKRALTGSEQRLKDIQDALSGNIPQPSQSSNLIQARPLLNKRPNPGNNSGQLEPPAKRRVLPTSWEEPEPVSQGLPSKRAIASKQQASSVVTTTKVAPAKAPAKVFLSTEQTQILKLASDGQSLFYTGSAGEFYNSFRAHISDMIRAIFHSPMRFGTVC